MLLGLGIWLCRSDLLAADMPLPQPASWVRTVDGWERAGAWNDVPSSPPSLHPLVVAAGQALLSLLALAIWAIPPRIEDSVSATANDLTASS
jgi:hypothetical protein